MPSAPTRGLTPQNIAHVFGVDAEIMGDSSSMRIIIHGALEREIEV